VIRGGKRKGKDQEGEKKKIIEVKNKRGKNKKRDK
jgi:hypothetical protein